MGRQAYQLPQRIDSQQNGIKIIQYSKKEDKFGVYVIRIYSHMGRLSNSRWSRGHYNENKYILRHCIQRFGRVCIESYLFANFLGILNDLFWCRPNGIKMTARIAMNWPQHVCKSDIRLNCTKKLFFFVIFHGWRYDWWEVVCLIFFFRIYIQTIWSGHSLTSRLM